MVLEQPVGAIMTSPVHTALPNASLEDLMVLMTEERIRHVPVVVEDRHGECLLTGSWPVGFLRAGGAQGGTPTEPTPPAPQG